MKYKVAYIDNRGTNEQPFGFVYLVRGEELAGRIGYGAHRDNPDPLAVWACRETPHDVNALAVDAARGALAKAFPHLATGG